MNSFHSTWRDCFQGRCTDPIYVWASREVRLSAPLTRTGQFSTSETRHFESIFDALQDDKVREVNCLKPVRGGGTLIADVWMPWTRVNDPGPFMFVLQTDPLADDHSYKVLRPTMESVASIKRQLDSLARDKQTARKIEFSDGNHLHINGPSIGNLQTNAFQYVVLDECWMYEKGRMGEAEGRVGDYLKQQRSKIFRVSQGGPRPHGELYDDDWNRTYHEATIHEWEIECQSCRKFMPAAFSGVRDDGSFWGVSWDKHYKSGGDWLISKCLESIRFECRDCGQVMIDGAKLKSDWNRTGRYAITEDKGRKKVSFHWEAVIDYPWTELVELWLNACNAEKRGDLAPKIQFYQKRRAMFKDEESLLRGGLNLRRLTYEINSDWPEEKARFLTIDRQSEDEFWWTVRAWSANKSRRLGFGKCYGFAALAEIATKFKVPTFMSATQGKATSAVFIDSRYIPKGDQGVYSQCIKNGWIAVSGAADHSFIHPTKSGHRIQRSYSPLKWGDPGHGTVTQGRRGNCPRFLFSKPQMNQKVQELIDAGAWEEPIAGEDPEMEKEYNAQMSSRVKRTEYDRKTNAVKVFWREGKNDHARDLANMQCFAAMAAGLLPDSATEQLTKSEQEAAA